MAVSLNWLYLWTSFVVIFICLHHVKGQCTGFPSDESTQSTSCSDALNDTSVCTYTCLDGYEASTSLTSTCNGTSWTVDPVTCSDINECSNNICQNGGTCSNSAGSYSCDCAGIGYTGDVCETAVNCGTITNPAHGGSTCTGTTYNTVCTFNCNTGYTSSGTDSSTCQANGQWSAHDFTCAAVNCGTITDPLHGGSTCTGTTYNTVCTLNCNTGYTSSGTDSSTCQANGQWSDHDFTCAAVNCGTITNPAHGGSTCTETTYNTVCTFYCNTGYTSSGTDSSICQANGQWSDHDFTCA
ncbi:E-selectin-like, partial [Saccoglossus kowalevskii]|uniref:Sushi, von Willebrand factor type A, EGF and pentraxin domain-containing protein 1-like n=1 Tax=Saccoglossus kowalevskii TaxID=10224 RepID=A0ABM0MXB9_SACKO